MAKLMNSVVLNLIWMLKIYSLNDKFGPMDLHNNYFFIFNQKYNKSLITQWGTEHKELGTNDTEVTAEGIWKLEEDQKQLGYFYIKNVVYEDYRITKNGKGDHEIIPYKGKYHTDQLWKFHYEGNSYYRIINFKYNNSRLTKISSFSKNLRTDDTWNRNNELWKLVPRFTALIYKSIIWQSNNGNNSESSSEEIELITGLKLANEKEISTKVGLERSLKKAISITVGGMYKGFNPLPPEEEDRILTELDTFLEHSEEADWSKTMKIDFTAPGSTNYRVTQEKVMFASMLKTDNCILRLSRLTTDISNIPFP